MRRVLRALDRFFFSPATAEPIAALRIAIAGVLLGQAIAVGNSFFDLYTSMGFVQAGAGEPGAVLPLHLWAGEAMALGIAEHVAVGALAIAYVVSLFFLLLGYKTRAAAIGAWLTHFILTDGQTTTYGADIFAHTALFFLVVMPCGAVWSLDSRRHPEWSTPSWGPRLSVRVLQIYLCIAYFASGAEKLPGPQWWDGDAIWRAMNLPSMALTDMSFLAHYPWLPKLAGWGTLVVETAYPIFIWPRATRRLWLVLTVGMHVGIAVFLGLWTFAFVMILLNVMAFGISAEPRERLVRDQAPRAVEELEALPGKAVAR